MPFAATGTGRRGGEWHGTRLVRGAEKDGFRGHLPRAPPARNNRQILTEVYYPAEVAGNDVPVADPVGTGFPVVAFGHGYLLTYNLYAYLWQALVPGGFILTLPRTEGSLLPSHEQFGLDLSFLVGAMQARGNDPSSPFYGKVGSTSAAAETNPSAIAAAADITDPALLFSGSYDCVAPPEDHQIPMYAAVIRFSRVTSSTRSRCNCSGRGCATC